MRVDTHFKVKAYNNGKPIEHLTEVFKYLIRAKAYAEEIKRLNPGMTVKIEQVW